MDATRRMAENGMFSSAENQHHNCDYTPFEGFRTAGSVRDVFLSGVHAVQNGKLVETGRGRYIPRDKMR